MACGCGKGRSVNGTRTVTLHTVTYADQTRRNYLTQAEAEAAVRASKRTSNPATYTPPVPA